MRQVVFFWWGFDPIQPSLSSTETSGSLSNEIRGERCTYPSSSFENRHLRSRRDRSCQAHPRSLAWLNWAGACGQIASIMEALPKMPSRLRRSQGWRSRAWFSFISLRGYLYMVLTTTASRGCACRLDFRYEESNEKEDHLRRSCWRLFLVFDTVIGWGGSF